MKPLGINNQKDNRQMNKVINPEQEHEYILHNSRISISLGFGLAVLTTDQIFNLSDKSMLVSASFYLIAALFVISTSYFLIKSNKFIKQSFSKSAWMGTYHDEFLNSVSLLGYKLSALVMSLIALLAMCFGDSLSDIVSLKALGTALVSLSFLIYGVVTYIKLHQDEDEEAP